MMAITDGKEIIILPSAEDYKAFLDGNKGPNTGGMGAISPSSLETKEFINTVKTTVMQPVLDKLREQEIVYKGILYAGLMVTSDNKIYVLEFNSRFGDPETQVVLSRVESDIYPWLAGSVKEQLPAGEQLVI